MLVDQTFVVPTRIFTIKPMAFDAVNKVAKVVVYTVVKLENTSGEVTHERYEPRLKRDKRSLTLGQYGTSAKTKIVHEIATFFYDHNQFGRLDFEHGCYSNVELGPNDDPSRYFVISPLTENKEGKEKAKLVSDRAKEVFKQFKKEQEEYKKNQAKGWDWIDLGCMEDSVDEGPRTDNVVNVEGHPNEARPLDLVHRQLQQPSHIDDSAMGDVMRDSCGGTLNSASHAVGTSGPTLFGDTNPCPDRYGMLKSSREVVLAVPSIDSQTAGHIFAYEAELGPSTAHGPFPSSASASGITFNSGNQLLEGFYLQCGNATLQETQWAHQQLVSTLQQENRKLKQDKQELKQDKQELKQDKLELKGKVAELEAQLSDKQTQLSDNQTQLSDLQRQIREHILCCSEEKRLRKKG